MALAFTSAARDASAQDQAAEPEEPPRAPEPPRQVVLEGQVGSWAPLGTYGLALDAEISSWLSVQAGFGTDIHDNGDVLPRFALMPRIRRPIPGVDGTFVSMGAGLSRGVGSNAIYRQDDELSVEHRFDDGVRLRGFAGLGFYLNAPATPVFGASVYYGVALGYAIDPNPSVPAERSLSAGRWYGWQSLALDAAALAISIRDGAAGRRAGLALYGLSGPMVQLAHHRYARAALSFALRALIPVTLAYLTQGTPGSDGGEDGIGSAVGAELGAVMAALGDDLGLGWAWGSGDR